MMIYLRIFLLLFVPVSFWITYSFLPETYSLLEFELPKMEKIELISYSLQQPTKEKEMVSPIYVAKNEIVTESIEKNSSTTTHAQKKQDTLLKENATFEESTSNSIQLDFNTSDINKTSNFYKILVLGDSMGEGIAYGLNKLKHKYPIKIKSLAKSSTTTYYWNAYPSLEKDINNYAPDVVMIVLGTNEWKVVGSKTKLNIMKIHSKIQKLGIKSIWITPPVSKSTKFYETVYDVYGDFTYDSRTLDVPRGSDCIHPILSGYMIWSKQILASIGIKAY